MNSHHPRHFYATVSDQGIRISDLFIKRHGETLGDSVFLKDSGSGETEWEVEPRAINGEIWLGKGWKEFMEFYSIKEGYLLMFKYQGHSRFLVTVFDKSSNETTYPVDPRLQIVKVESESEPEENSGTTVPVKKKVNVKQNRGNGRRLEKGRDSDENGEKKTRAPRRRVVGTYAQRCSGTKTKVKACERVFKSEHPFFGHFIHPSNISNNYLAGVPQKFCRAHFTGEEISGEGLKFSIRLFGEEKKWPILLKYYTVKNTRGSLIFRGSGWRQFARQKEVTVGEVCIFELVKEDKVFNVYRFK